MFEIVIFVVLSFFANVVLAVSSHALGPDEKDNTPVNHNSL